ncbi:MAG TPA: Rid family detoxifying hydrolase [Planctomycetota bacterium]|nr:Rid family detoxifying hydrolase [Planctomycetota bacterium]
MGALLAALVGAGCFVHVRADAERPPRPTRSWPQSARAPAPVGPYSQAVRVGDTLWLAGQVGVDPDTGALVEGGVGPQTARALANLAAVLEAAGMGLADLVEVQVFLADIDDFAAMNAIYAATLPVPAPARTTVGVAALPLGAAVEIRAVAVRTR